MLNRVYFETRSFQKCQYFEPETPNSRLLVPDSLVSKLQFSIWMRFRLNLPTEILKVMAGLGNANA